MRRPIDLDKINRRIMIELQQDARVTNIELAERIGLSPSACLKRVQALEASGCIHKYVMAADLDRIVHNVQGYFLIDMQDVTLRTTSMFEAHVANLPQLVDCLRVGGAPDYIAFVVCSDIPQMKDLMNEILGADLNVRRINLQVVISRPKWFSGYPLEALTWKTRA